MRESACQLDEGQPSSGRHAVADEQKTLRGLHEAVIGGALILCSMAVVVLSNLSFFCGGVGYVEFDFGDGTRQRLSRRHTIASELRRKCMTATVQGS